GCEVRPRSAICFAIEGHLLLRGKGQLLLRRRAIAGGHIGFVPEWARVENGAIARLFSSWPESQVIERKTGSGIPDRVLPPDHSRGGWHYPERWAFAPHGGF